MSSVGAHAGSGDSVLDGTWFGLRDKLRKTANAKRDFMNVESATRMFTVAVTVALTAAVVALVSVVIGGGGKVTISWSSKYAIFSIYVQ
ncbi:hypothetical protein L195_g041815 [Trifolium pratense]|uniref:Uncharacterized protein n=1 Tax=Trifolium pratense TaxID=57577 RepID=A0A2K3M4M6_TRIPR|nr:hypothetical protein L195_g041815 [Trifolium pratense]